MPIFDACIDTDINLIHVRHEAAAVYMADAWAQLSGEIGVALVAAGPGFINALSPLYSAMAAESPTLLISGDTPMAQDGMGAFQELAQTVMSTPICKAALRCENAKELGNNIATAIQIAKSGRPGPVHLSIPIDLLTQQVGNVDLPLAHQFVPEVMPLGANSVINILKILSSANRPLVLTGPASNPSRAAKIAKSLEESLDTPVIAVQSPRGLRDPALGTFAQILPEADVVLCLGKKVDFSINLAQSPPFGAQCQFMVIEADAKALNQAKSLLGGRTIVSVLGDATVAMQQLIEANENNPTNRRCWREKVKQAIAAYDNDFVNDSKSEKNHPAALCRSVQRVLESVQEPILVTDGGEFGQWAQAYINAPTRIINGPSGAIGGGLCYAIGAKLNRPDATVVALTGDGSVGFHLSEFDTALRYGVPFIAIIGNDARWNAEVQIQLRDYGADRLIGCELNATRYDLAVKGLGGHGEYVTETNELDQALERAFTSELPACVNVEIKSLAAPSF